VESPISVAVDLEFLRESGNPEQRQLADVLTGVAELKALVEKKFSDPSTLLPPSYLREILMSDMREAIRRPRIPPSLCQELLYCVDRLGAAVASGEGKSDDSRMAEVKDLSHHVRQLAHMMASDSGFAPEMFAPRRKPDTGA
jgi:hypothetical protein